MSDHPVKTSIEFRQKFDQEVPKPKKPKHVKKAKNIEGKTWSQLTKAEKDDALEILAAKMGLVLPEEDPGS